MQHISSIHKSFLSFKLTPPSGRSFSSESSLSFDLSVPFVKSISAAALRFLYASPLNTDFLFLSEPLSCMGGFRVLVLCCPPLLRLALEAWLGVNAVRNAFVDYTLVALRPSNFDLKVTVD